MLIDFRSTHIDGSTLASIKPSTCAKVHAAAQDILHAGTISAAEASSLVGKFRWIACLGRMGLAATQPLTRIANSAAGKARHGLVSLREDQAATQGLSLIASLTDGSLPPAIYMASAPQAPIVVFSDAPWDPRPPLLFGFGQVAYIVIERNPDGSEKCFFAAAEVPQEVLRRLHNLRTQKTFICPLEEIAMAAPFLSPELRDTLRGRDVLHFADNQGANCIAIKGYSSAPDLARIVSVVHLNIAKLQVRWWVAFVPSANDPADAPSKGDFAELEAAGAVRIDFSFPSLASWAA